MVFDRIVHRIDRRIPRHKNRLRIAVFFQQVQLTFFCRRKMQIG